MLAFIAFVVLAQDPVDVEKWAKIPDTVSPEAAKSLRDFARQAEAGRLKSVPKRKPPVLTGKSSPERKQLLDAAKAQAARDALEVAGVTIPTPDLWSGPHKAGQIGGGKPFGAKITQIVDDNVFVTITGFTISEVRGRVSIEPNGKDETIVIHGIETAGLVDGTAYESDALLICVGSKQYPTVTGATRTLWTFEPYPYEKELREWEALRIKAHAETKSEKKKK